MEKSAASSWWLSCCDDRQRITQPKSVCCRELTSRLSDCAGWTEDTVPVLILWFCENCDSYQCRDGTSFTLHSVSLSSATHHHKPKFKLSPVISINCLFDLDFSSEFYCFISLFVDWLGMTSLSSPKGILWDLLNGFILWDCKMRWERSALTAEGIKSKFAIFLNFTHLPLASFQLRLQRASLCGFML